MNRILFLVEGKKTESSLLKILFSKVFGKLEKKNIEQDNVELFENEKISILIQWIKDGNITKFYEKLDSLFEDPYSDEISLQKVFCNDLNLEFSMEFILIDADMKDDIPKSTKKEFLLKLNELINKFDNTHLLISSPMIEGLFDSDDVYNYNSQYGYKKIVNAKVEELCQGKGMNTYFESDFSNILGMNIKKFEDIDYDNQRMLSINKYNEENKRIFIRNNLFHIFAEHFFIFNNKDIIKKIKELKNENSI